MIETSTRTIEITSATLPQLIEYNQQLETILAQLSAVAGLRDGIPQMRFHTDRPILNHRAQEYLELQFNHRSHQLHTTRLAISTTQNCFAAYCDKLNKATKVADHTGLHTYFPLNIYCQTPHHELLGLSAIACSDLLSDASHQASQDFLDSLALPHQRPPIIFSKVTGVVLYTLPTGSSTILVIPKQHTYKP